MNHNEWIEIFKRTARVWRRRYGLDADECFSELLVAYAEALDSYSGGKGMAFGSWYWFFQRKALARLLRDKRLHADTSARLTDLTPGREGAMEYAMMRLDAELDDGDVAAALGYLDSRGLEQTSRVGRSTVARELQSALGWAKGRALRAVDALGRLYQSYCGVSCC